MQPVLVTLTTDFGTGSTYVAAMKGVIAGIAPDARILDLSHDIPPQDVRAAALFLRDALPYFPPRTIHVAVVDPGVGGNRAALLAKANDCLILAPDNGIWTLAAPNPDTVLRLNQPRYWRHPVSATFHGRDIFAPVAGHLAMGVDPSHLGESVTTWNRLDLPTPAVRGDSTFGAVIAVDRFGNLMTNLTLAPGAHVVCVADQTVEIVRTYSDRTKGTLVALASSNGLVEIAVVDGSAAATLGVGVGTLVELRGGLVS